VFARELEVARKEKKLAKKEEHLEQREEVIMELQAKLNALNKILEEQRVQQTATVESLQRLQQELDDKASSIALAEENLKEKDASLDKRATDLT
jgi:peptidoglycan hydrolase CwlO-like protein